MYRTRKATHMLDSIKARLGRDDEQGFTLIELMVVVLIIAILLAIAIPTFLGARNSANARAAQSNLRNALTAEQTEWTNTQTFSADTSTTGMAGIEGSLTWTTGAPASGNVVSVTVGDVDTSGNYQAVALEATGKDHNCYTVLQSNDPANSFTAYNVASGSCTAAPTVPTISATAPTINATGTASANKGTGYYKTW
jgi:type IV pilus assembly protein PilA